MVTKLFLNKIHIFNLFVWKKKLCIFSVQLCSIADDKKTIKQFLFDKWKIRAEGYSILRWVLHVDHCKTAFHLIDIYSRWNHVEQIDKTKYFIWVVI